MAYVPDEAIDRLSELSKGARHLYVFLARVRNQQTGKCCPSVSTTMSNLGCNRGTVYSLRSELAAKGWASFDGDNVPALFGFASLKNQTLDQQSEKSDSLNNQTTIGANKELTQESLNNQTSPKNQTVFVANKGNSESLKNQTEAEKSEKSDSHIRKNQQSNQSSFESAKNEQRRYLQKAAAKPQQQFQNLGRFEFADYLAYVQAKNPEKQIAQATGLATWMRRNGQDDDAVEAWKAAMAAPARAAPGVAGLEDFTGAAARDEQLRKQSRER